MVKARGIDNKIDSLVAIPVTKTRRTLIVPNQAIATYVTQWTYDSHNRLIEMIYPDEEKVTYSYNLGGLLEKVRGEKSYGYDYITKLGYDKFEQRSYLKYCNGSETFYTYDGLYRLATATGTYTGTDNKSASYTLAMGYDNMHRIKSKSQHLTQDNVQFNGTLNVGYDLTYTYGSEEGKKFQLESVKDVNYRTEETPEGQQIENGHGYSYDKNGNLVYVNTNRVMTDGHKDNSVGERKLIWDEENRLLAVDDNGFVSNYWYDADGERTVKTSGESDQVYVNGVFSGGSTNTAKFSLYVSPYLVANQGGRYTKHIYAGSQRIVSKVGDFASYGSDPRRIEYAGANTDGLSVDYKSKYAAQQQVIKDNYKFFDVPYNGTDNDNYADGEGFCCNDGSIEAAVAQARKAQARAVSRSFKDPDNYENLQFFYHPDHLGSSSFITNLDGEVVQHIEYVPFGEVFIEERNNVWNTPYLFNAKEFDEETGMYYYGARYYEPRVSIWISSDPLQEKYPNFATYCYVYNNPLRFVDRIGLEGDDSQTIMDKVISLLPDEIGKDVRTIINGLTKNDNSSLSRIAIGVEYSVSGSVTSGAKGEVSGIIGNVVFLGGPDAGFVYSYGGGEIGAGAEVLSAGVNGSVERTAFVAVQNNTDPNHAAFAGDYVYSKVSIGGELPVKWAGISGSYSIAEGVHSDPTETYWTVYSRSIGVSTGVGASTGITGGATLGVGTIRFIGDQKVGKPKSLFEKILSLPKLMH